MSESDDFFDYSENYMEQDDYLDNESESTDLKQLDKRAHHNALERKRRDHIKDSFSSLRDAIPLLHGEKINSHKASRAQILKKAAEYIDHMRKKNNDHQKDIDLLKRENKLLEEKIKALEEFKNSSNNGGTKPVPPPQAANASSSTRTRSVSKSLIANNSASNSTNNSTNGSSNSLSTSSSTASSTNSSNNNINNANSLVTNDGTSILLQQNRVKSESISSFEVNSDDSENLIDNNTETVVQIVKKANVIATTNGKLMNTANGKTILVNGTIIKQQASNPQQTSLLEPPNKRKRLIIAANTIISK